MVKVTFSRWLLPRRSPSVSAKVEGLNLPIMLEKWSRNTEVKSVKADFERLERLDLPMI